MNRLFSLLAVCLAITVTVACGGGAPAGAPAPSAAPAAAAAPGDVSKPLGTLSLIEPMEGAMGGHIDTFRWSAVDGADGYVVKIQASDGRVVWESPVLVVTETKLPTSVALEPEVHTWQVSSRKAGQVLAASAAQKFTITP